MTWKLTKADFEKMGIEPCSTCIEPIEPDDPYWWACAYHEGYFDAFNQCKCHDGDVVTQEMDRLKNNFLALGAAWRGSWFDFDGRHLQAQIRNIFDGENEGIEFYHDHITKEYGHNGFSETCAEFGCKICAQNSKRETQGE